MKVVIVIDFTSGGVSVKNSKRKNHVVVVVFIIVLLIIIGSNHQRRTQDNYEVSTANTEDFFSLVDTTSIINSIINLPRHLWSMIWNPSELQMRFFLRDGFALADTIREQEIENLPRIGQIRNEAEELYMLTWQPAESSVRRSNLIHAQNSQGEIPQPRYINSDEPLVYIFNSHPAELVGAPGAGRYREGTTSIIEFSHMIANTFSDYRIPVLVEDRDVRNILSANAWSFAQSYQASRIFIEERIFQYPSLEFFFDIHRDAVPDEVAHTVINGVDYARVAFVIGLHNPEYEENLTMASKLHDMLEAVRPGISRGIILSSGWGRNGIYNQDVAPTLQLIEIGSYQSTVEAMVNTTEILANVLAEYILNYIDE